MGAAEAAGVALRFALAALAVWRLAHLLVREAGPWRLLARLRGVAARLGLGTLAGCVKCLSLWLALPFAPFVAADPATAAVAWLALSGAAVLLEEHLPAPFLLEPEAPAGPIDDATTDGGRAPGDDDELLRTG